MLLSLLIDHKPVRMDLPAGLYHQNIDTPAHAGDGNGLLEGRKLAAGGYLLHNPAPDVIYRERDDSRIARTDLDVQVLADQHRIRIQPYFEPGVAQIALHVNSHCGRRAGTCRIGNGQHKDIVSYTKLAHIRKGAQTVVENRRGRTRHLLPAKSGYTAPCFV